MSITRRSRYRLLKDTPSDKKGDIFEYRERGLYSNIMKEDQMSGAFSSYHAKYIEDNPEWFEVVVESEIEPREAVNAIERYDELIAEAREMAKTCDFTGINPYCMLASYYIEMKEAESKKSSKLDGRN